MRLGIPSAGMVGKQGVAATVSSRLVCQPCLLYMPAFASLCKRQPPIIIHAIYLTCHLSCMSNNLIFLILLAYTTFSYNMLS
jgi:hypothetical protein